MGGVVPAFARELHTELGGLDAIDVSILYDLADASGADAIDYIDRFNASFEVCEGGRRRSAMPLGDLRRVHLRR